ncbi:kinase-like domain-containing protein, partial [Thamnocephalis sphaerospora]
GRALGSGSGGSVTLYHRERDGIPVAVKRFASARVGESLQHRRNKVDAEIRMLCTLDHPNIMSALDVIELSEAEDTPTRRVVSNGMRYSADTRTVKLLVTECFPSDLFSTVEGNLSSSETRRLFYQLLSAVAHMHERGVAHRDLKLENICMDRHGSLKVIDLGNAIRIRAGQYSSKALSFGVYGSDPYVDVTAKLAGAGYNPFHADLWALGILLIAMTQKSFAW